MRAPHDEPAPKGWPLATPRGRPPSTTHAEVAGAAFRLFATIGFDETTMDDIAGELGIGRRTLFRYFASKNDLVWGDFDSVLKRLREAFTTADAQEPMMTALREAVVTSNTYADEALPELRVRMTLITRNPALQGHSMVRYAEWRAVVAEFAAHRLRRKPEDFAPVAIGYAALGASMSAFAHWVDHPEKHLVTVLGRSYELLEAGFDPELVRSRTREF